MTLRWEGSVPARGDDLEADGGAFLAADHIHDLVELHPHAIDELPIALRHRADAVVDLQPAITLGGAAGDQFHDFRIAILRVQDRADADQREPHVDREVLQVALAQVLRVRIVGQGERRKEIPDDILIGLLVEVEQELVVTAGERP